MRILPATACIFLIFPVISVHAQEPRAEERVEAFRVAGDLEGLAAFSLAVIDAYRGQKLLLSKQQELANDLLNDRTRYAEGLENIRLALDEERAARVKLEAMLANLEEPRWKLVLGGLGQGATIGGSISRTATGAGIGGALGSGVQWLLSRRKK